MSGIAGIFHADGSRADRALLERMTSFLAFRGPDAQQTWSEGAVGLGHALLRTTRESAGERQPCTLDGAAWITADARVDARPDLIAQLAARGCRVPPDANDAQLILHAYHAWGEGCAGHLLGDFAFAIWDTRERRLFCARDHFGVKPFYYARSEGRFAFSNTLNCLRLAAGVSDRLNEQFIADLLLLSFNQDPSTTAFADVRRLPPAHALVVSEREFRLRRYWSLPNEEPLRYASSDQYAEHFRNLLGQAVQDRLRAPSAAVLMSGGLDSCSVAAVAKHAPAAGGGSLRAVTLVSRSLLPDSERHFAGLAAHALGIPVEFLDVDRFGLYAEWDRLALPEPVHEPFLAIQQEQLRCAAGHARVLLTGQGGDPVFSTSVTHYARLLLRRRQFGRLLADFARFARAEGRLSRLYLRTRIGVLRSRNQPPPALPAWLHPDFSARLRLDERRALLQPSPPAKDALRPSAVESLQSPLWAYQFELCDPGVTRIPLECRHPYFDLRVLAFLLRLPPVPWCTDKELVRVAMRGMLPDEVRLRRKSPLSCDPVLVHLRRASPRWWQAEPAAAALGDYVDWEKVLRLDGSENASLAWTNLAPVSLNLWLRRRVGFAAREQASGLSK